MCQLVTGTEGDKYVIGAAHFFVALGSKITASFATKAFSEQQDNLRTMIESIDVEALEKTNINAKSASGYKQLTFAL